MLFTLAGNYGNVHVLALSFRAPAASVETYEQHDTSSGGEMPNTPNMSSDTGDSLQDPGSVPLSDMASPPSSGLKSSQPPPHKKYESTSL